MNGPRTWGLPKSWNLNQILFGMLAVLFFVLPLHQELAGIVFFLCFFLNLCNVYKTGQFWPTCHVPKAISRSLWALFLLSLISCLWSPAPGASLFNWVWVVGQEAGIFIWSCGTPVPGGVPCFS